MRIVRPLTITDSNLQSNNVAENEHPDWADGTYNLGEKVIFEHEIYEVVADPSTTDQPDVGAAKTVPTWTNLGATNAWAMFDDSVSTQTENSGTIDITIDPNELVNAVTLFNISATTAQIIVTDPVDGEVYNRTVNLLEEEEITNWFAWFFNEITGANKLVCLDLPQYASATIRIILDAGAGTAKAGVVAMGRQTEIGITDHGTTVGIVDYSKRTRDEFGELVTVQRGFSDLVEYDVTIDTAKVTAVKRILAGLRGTTTVFIGEDSHGATVVYGIYNDFQIQYQNFTTSTCTISVEGLV